jgi:phage gpG-like protein
MNLKIEEAITAAVDEGTTLTRRKLIEHLSQPGSGTTYGNHTASAPGQPPARDTATLANSIQARVIGREGSVGTNLEYAEFLQLGTRNMDEREYLESMWERFGEAIESTMVSEFERKL